MRSFTTNKQFQITNCDDEAGLLFEHLESYANGLRFQVQEKNEAGRWGGRGTDVEFTIYNTQPSRKQVVEEYRRFYGAGRVYVSTVPMTLKF